jgi:hypothetical protein
MENYIKDIYTCLLVEWWKAGISQRIQAEIDGHITFCHTGVYPEPSEMVKFFYKYWVKYGSRD